MPELRSDQRGKWMDAEGLERMSLGSEEGGYSMDVTIRSLMGLSACGLSTKPTSLA